VTALPKLRAGSSVCPVLSYLDSHIGRGWVARSFVQNLRNATGNRCRVTFARTTHSVKSVFEGRMISWKMLRAVLLIVGLLAGIKYVFDLIEKHLDK
jgi:hypothetical protein